MTTKNSVKQKSKDSSQMPQELSGTRIPTVAVLSMEINLFHGLVMAIGLVYSKVMKYQVLSYIRRIIKNIKIL